MPNPSFSVVPQRASALEKVWLKNAMFLSSPFCTCDSTPPADTSHASVFTMNFPAFAEKSGKASTGAVKSAARNVSNDFISDSPHFTIDLGGFLVCLGSGAEIREYFSMCFLH